MKKTILHIVLAPLCFFFKADAQDRTSNIVPLKIGDTIPDQLWKLPLQVVNHPDGKDTITLNDYRGKLIILDFWATNCSSSWVASLEKIIPIYNEFKRDISLIPIASHQGTRIKNFMSEKLWDLPSVMDSNLLYDSTSSRITISQIFNN